MYHSIVRATPELVEKVFENLREDARVELGEVSKSVVLTRIFEKSAAWVGLAKEEPACAFGVREGNFTEPAELWLVATPLIEVFSVRFLRESRAVVDWAVREYGVVGGVVQVGNERSQRWLRWLEFGLKEEAEHSWLGRV